MLRMVQVLLGGGGAELGKDSEIPTLLHVGWTVGCQSYPPQYFKSV